MNLQRVISRAFATVTMLAAGCWCRADGLTEVAFTTGEYPPYLSRDLPHGGSAARIVEDALAAQGVHVHYQFFPWQRAYEEAREGSRFAGSVMWLKTPAREKDFLYSDPVVVTRSVLFYAKSAPVRWNTLGDLAGLRLGGAQGYFYGEEWARLEQSGVLHVDRVAVDDTNIAKLAKGHIQAVPLELEVGLYTINRMPGMAEQLGYDPKTILEAPMYLLVSRNWPGGAELIRRFNAGLAQLRSNGVPDRYIMEGRKAQPAGR
jgi:polar amino acid transport system substrate-binding protein